jgi:hypothetical protein
MPRKLRIEHKETASLCPYKFEPSIFEGFFLLLADQVVDGLLTSTTL